MAVLSGLGRLPAAVAVAMLSITGIAIWARKRRSQLREERRAMGVLSRDAVK